MICEEVAALLVQLAEREAPQPATGGADVPD